MLLEPALVFRAQARIFEQRAELPGVPEYDPAIQAELERAAEAFLDRLFQEMLGLRELLTRSRRTLGVVPRSQNDSLEATS